LRHVTPCIISIVRLEPRAATRRLSNHGSSAPAPHQQRGNRRAPVFFEDGDHALYRDLLAERCRKASVACWAYCLMPNHVHLILATATADGLAAPSARRTGSTPAS
jgi:hypothetical protein